MSFSDFALHDSLERGLADLGFEEPTPIQSQAIPPALEGKDILGTAQTGTGKTLAFLLPAMQQLLQAPAVQNPRMLILAPTRELALQIAGDATELARNTRLRVVVVYGGAPIKQQTDQLRRGADIIVATPGRLLDHIQRRNLQLRDVGFLVLDEADRMLDMGFLPDIDDIIRRLPAERQTMLFSATMPATVVGLGHRYMRSPVRIEVATARPPAALRQELYPVPKHLKRPLLCEMLSRQSVTSALVFTRTRQDADILLRQLSEIGMSVTALHGDYNQRDRLRALEAFRAGRARVLVATNVAARGLDIDGISHVINYDVPEEPEDYVHRIGRTARVEAEGVAWTLVTPDDEPLIARIEYLLGEKIERLRLPGFDYDVPTPDWARPSAKALLREVKRQQSTADRWKAMTR
ncbi:MAG: DEAD/DEAH box helicase [Anaerolineales bacterium]|nr:DEAD/DEAH box helicase [Anaerolineales bacterium]